MKTIIIPLNKLFESPDELYLEGKDYVARYEDKYAYPFGVNKQGKISVGEEGSTHGSVPHHNDYDSYEGRIWTIEKIMSFWEAPPKYILENILNQLSKKFNIDAFKFKIEIPESTSNGEDFTNFNDNTHYTTYKSYDHYPENIGISHIKMNIDRPEHELSPLLKQRHPGMSYNGGSKLTAWDSKRNIKVRQAERTSEGFYPKMNESPDLYNDEKEDNMIFWHSRGFKPITFGWLDSRYRTQNGFHWYGDYDDYQLGELVTAEYDTHESMYSLSGDQYLRSNYIFPGRLWLASKVISFWHFPGTEIFPTLLKDLEKELGIKFDSSWRVNVKKYKPGEELPSWVNEPISNYAGGIPLSQEELNKQHAVSPLLKKQKKSYGGGSKLTGWDGPRNIKWRQAMYAESFYPRMNESPDWYNDDKFGNVEVSWDDVGYKPITFGWWKGELVTAKTLKDYYDQVRATHGYMLDKNKNTHYREDYDYPGRLWVKTKVISFWKFPPKEVFPELIKDLEDKLKIKIDSTWRVNIKREDNYNWENIPITNYIGSAKLSQEELNKQHVVSPLLKYKKEVPSGIGSKKYGKELPLRQRQMMYAESLQENESTIISYIEGFLDILPEDGKQREFLEWKLKNAKLLTHVKTDEISKEYPEIGEYIKRNLHDINMKECYRNAGKLAMDVPGVDYIEGEISYHGIPIEHAWNKIDGKYFDITKDILFPKNSDYAEYVKIIELPAKEMLEFVMKYKHWGGWIVEKYKKDHGLTETYYPRIDESDAMDRYYARKGIITSYEPGFLKGKYIEVAAVGDKRTPIVKNPKTLEGFDLRVRAISDKKGNIYIAMHDGDFNHGMMGNALMAAGVIQTKKYNEYESNYMNVEGVYADQKNFLLLNRVPGTYQFVPSDVFEWEGTYSELLFKKVKSKNPHFSFHIPIQENKNSKQ